MHVHFVTGGTGFIGRHLVSRLLRSGHTVHILTRPNPHRDHQSIYELFSGEVSSQQLKNLVIVPGDLLENNMGLSDTYLSTLRYCTMTLWHLGADLSFDSQLKERVTRTNVEGARNIIAFANRYAKVLNYMSTIYICGNKTATITEDTLELGQQFNNPYEESKFKAEQLVRSTTTTAYRIFRPSIVIGHAYEGKAVGCTFGYYRYIFLFELLRQWVSIALRSKETFASRLLRLLGTTFDDRSGKLHLPWLLMPYPRSATVDLVPVDFVIECMLDIADKNNTTGLTFHITSPTPPSYRNLLKGILEDLIISGVKSFPVPNKIFPSFFTIGYIFLIPLRRYIRSLTWYLPYITGTTPFPNHNRNRMCDIKLPPLSRTTMRRINTYAKQEIFSRIAI